MKRQHYLVIASVFIVIAIGVALGNELTMEKKASEPPVIVIRIDDVQDFAFREAQLYLMEYSRVNKIPASLAVIPKYFGEDQEIVDATIQAIKSGCEVVVHGWEHEDLAQFSLNEQKLRLLDGKQHLEGLLSTEIEALVPPMFSYNDDTVLAMEETGYTIVSGITEFHEKGWVSEKILSMPATIELSDYRDEVWQMKNSSVILKEVEVSIETFGYAMIVTHPQEFMKENSLDSEKVNKYEQILQKILESYSFTTIQDLGG